MRTIYKHPSQKSHNVYSDNSNGDMYLINDSGQVHKLMHCGNVVDNKFYDFEGHLKAVIKED